MEEIAVQCLSAGAGSAAASLVFAPLETIKTRLQASRDPGAVAAHEECDDERSEEEEVVAYAGPGEVVRDLMRERGVLGLFQGAVPVVFRSALTDAVYFLINSALVSRFERALERKLSAPEAVIVGIVSACTTQVMGHPLDKVTTRIMTDQQGRGALHHANAIVSGGKEVGTKRNYAALWDGYTSSMALSINPALQFTVFDRTKAFCEQRFAGGKELNAQQIFCLGMVTKALTLTILYPMIRGKTFASNSDQFGGSMWQAIAYIFRTEGFLSLYKGLREQIGKSTLSTAFLLTCKEEIAMLVRRLITPNKSVHS